MLSLPRLKFLSDSRDHSNCIFMIDFAQNGIVEIDSRNIPKPLRGNRFLGVWKVLVLGFQETPIESQSLLGPWAVGAEKNTIRVLFQESFSLSWLAAKFTDTRCELDIEIRQLVQPL